MVNKLKDGSPQEELFDEGISGIDTVAEAHVSAKSLAGTWKEEEDGVPVKSEDEEVAEALIELGICRDLDEARQRMRLLTPRKKQMLLDRTYKPPE